jgi:hypothetical protein
LDTSLDKLNIFIANFYSESYTENIDVFKDQQQGKLAMRVPKNMTINRAKQTV